jgi:hypothetical protein
MSIGPMGFASFVAGAPLAASKGSDIERSLHAASAKDRQVQTDKKASDAAGIGSTDGEDHQTEDRDADGRRLWELPQAEQPAEDVTDESTPAPPTSKDASGDSGHQLDLSV